MTNQSEIITFDYRKYGSPTSSYFLRSGLIADLNNDNKNEFIFSVSSYPQVHVPLNVISYQNNLLTDEGIIFTNSIPSVKHSPFIFFEDIDNNGLKDLVVSEAGLDQPPWTGSKIAIAINNGNTFTNIDSLIPGTTLRNYSIAIGNFNADSQVDVFLSNQYTDGKGDGALLNYDGKFVKTIPNPIQNWQDLFLNYSTSMSVADFNQDGYDDLLLSGNWIGRSNAIVYGSKVGLDGNTLNELDQGPYGQDGFYALLHNDWSKTIISAETNSIAFDFNHDGKSDIFSVAQEWFQYQPRTITDKTIPNFDLIYKDGGTAFGKNAYQTLFNIDGKKFQSVVPDNSDLGYRFYFQLQSYDVNLDGNLDVIGFYNTVSRTTDEGGTLFGTTFFINDGRGNFEVINASSKFPNLNQTPYLSPGSPLATYQLTSGLLVETQGKVSDDQNQIIEGVRSLYGHYFGDKRYQPILRSDPASIKFNAKETYRVEFSYKIIETPTDGFECLFYSPTGGSQGNWLPSVTVNGKAGDYGRIYLNSTLNDFSDYQVRWNVIGNGSIVIDQIAVTEVSTNRVYIKENFDDAISSKYSWKDTGLIVPVIDDGITFTGIQLNGNVNSGIYTATSFTMDSLSRLSPYPITIYNRNNESKINLKSLSDLIYDSGANRGVTYIDGGEGIDFSVYSGRYSDYYLGSRSDFYNVKSTSIDHQLLRIERLKFSDRLLAIDLDGNSGNAARLLATVFGKDAVKNPTYAGIAISLFDQGYSKDQVSQVALNAVLGANAKSKDVVSLIWKNLTGSAIDSKNLADLSGLIDSKAITAAQLTTKAAELDLTAQLIDLVGLGKTGWEYIPYGG